MQDIPPKRWRDADAGCRIQVVPQALRITVHVLRFTCHVSQAGSAVPALFRKSARTLCVQAPPW